MWAINITLLLQHYIFFLRKDFIVYINFFPALIWKHCWCIHCRFSQFLVASYSFLIVYFLIHIFLLFFYYIIYSSTHYVCWFFSSQILTLTIPFTKKFKSLTLISYILLIWLVRLCKKNISIWFLTIIMNFTIILHWRERYNLSFIRLSEVSISFL